MSILDFRIHVFPKGITFDTMQNALLVLRNLAEKTGFRLSFEPIGSLPAQSQAHLVNINSAGATELPDVWLANALAGVAHSYQLAPDLSASALKNMRQAIYQNFQLTPKEFIDVLRGANLLAKMRTYNPQSVSKLAFFSGASCYSVFQEFIHRTFQQSPADVFQKPDIALAALEARVPIMATALVEHFTVLLQNNATMKNEQSLFLVFLKEKPTHKTNAQNQRTKPTHKTNAQNQRTKLLTEGV